MLRKIKNIFYRSISNGEINYDQAKKIMNNNTDFILIDVRSKQEYLEGHLISAINIPLYDIEKNIFNVVEDKNKIIIVYCSSGSRSLRAKEILKQLGFKNVYNIKTNINEMLY